MRLYQKGGECRTRHDLSREYLERGSVSRNATATKKFDLKIDSIHRDLPGEASYHSAHGTPAIRSCAGKNERSWSRARRSETELERFKARLYSGLVPRTISLSLLVPLFLSLLYFSLALSGSVRNRGWLCFRVAPAGDLRRWWFSSGRSAGSTAAAGAGRSGCRAPAAAG